MKQNFSFRKLGAMKEIKNVLSQPPICLPPIKTLGTVLCPVHPASAACISGPSPSRRRQGSQITYQMLK